MASHWSRGLISRAEKAFQGAAALGSTGVHLAIFVQPYLDLILSGEKTIESRFGVQRCAPHGVVSKGDILLLKQSGGPVVAACRVGPTWYFDLQATPLKVVRARFERRICPATTDFWKRRAHAKVATLMAVRSVRRLSPFTVAKRDRRGWVMLRPHAPLLAK